MTNRIQLSESQKWTPEIKKTLLALVIGFIVGFFIDYRLSILFAATFACINGFGFRVILNFEKETIIWCRRIFFLEIPFTRKVYQKSTFNKVTLSIHREQSKKSTFPVSPLTNMNFDITEAFLTLSSNQHEHNLIFPMFTELKPAKELAKEISKAWGYSFKNRHQKMLERNKATRKKREKTGRK